VTAESRITACVRERECVCGVPQVLWGDMAVIGVQLPLPATVSYWESSGSVRVSIFFRIVNFIV
jgi:hypothetical protein